MLGFFHRMFWQAGDREHLTKVSVSRLQKYRGKFEPNNTLEVELRFIIFSALALMCQLAKAETVQVKYHGAVSLSTFECADVKEHSDVSRICYDKAERYMVIQLKKTYYHYCEIDAATVTDLQRAHSKRQFFETRIRGSGSDGPFDCRTHPVPRRYRK